MTNNITTTVLIPHYNNLTGLIKSVSSIYHPKGIHVLVIDDGSDFFEKPNLELLSKHLNKNVKLTFLALDENRGITKTLNAGLKYILQNTDYKFIARLDCGDVCVKNRFVLQESFLEKNTDVGLVGSHVTFNSEQGEQLFKIKPPKSHEDLQKLMHWRCNFIHPSVMFTRESVLLAGEYPENYETAEDYAFFFQISRKLKTANIPGVLTKVEFNPNGISGKYRKLQNKTKARVIRDFGDKSPRRSLGVVYNRMLNFAPSSIIFSLKKLILN